MADKKNTSISGSYSKSGGSESSSSSKASTSSKSVSSSGTSKVTNVTSQSKGLGRSKPTSNATSSSGTSNVTKTMSTSRGLGRSTAPVNPSGYVYNRAQATSDVHGINKGAVGNDMQTKVDSLGIAYNDPNRDFHFYKPSEGASQSYLEEALNINANRNIWAYNQYQSSRDYQYKNEMEQYEDNKRWQQDAQIYMDYAKEHGLTATLADGTEVDVADLWGKAIEDMQFDYNYRYYAQHSAEDRNVIDTTNRLQMAQDNYAGAQSDEERARWQEVIDVYTALYNEDNRMAFDDDNKQIEANNQLITQLNNQYSSVQSVVSGWVTDRNNEYNQYAAKSSDLAKQIEALNSQNASLEADKSRLNSELTARNMTPEIQEIIDRLSMPTKERKSVYRKMVLENYPGLKGGALNDMIDVYINADQERMDQFNLNLEMNPRMYNSGDMFKATVGSWGKRAVEAGLNLVTLAGQAVDYGTGLANLDQESLAEQAYATDPTMLTKDMTAEQQAYTNAFNENGGNGTKLAEHIDAIESYADELGQSAQLELARAKEGASKLGKFGLDAVGTILDIGLDTVTHGKLLTMFARVMGSSAGEARRAGATAGQQFFYGLTNAGIETFTEILGPGLDRFYGKGTGAKIVEDVLEKFAKSNPEANIMRFLFGAISEGGEEVISDLLNPYVQWIIDEGARDNRIYQLDPAELLYDFLLGSTIGALGEVTKVGEYKELNQTQINKMTDKYEATIERLSQDATSVATHDEQRNANNLSSRLSGSKPTANPNKITKQNIKSKVYEATHGVKAPEEGSKTRTDKAVDAIVDGMNEKGYKEPVNKDDAYMAGTTGSEERKPSAEGSSGKAPPVDDNDAPPPNGSGGDAWVPSDEDAPPPTDENIPDEDIPDSETPPVQPDNSRDSAEGLEFLYKSGGIGKEEFIKRMVEYGYRDEAWAEKMRNSGGEPQAEKPKPKAKVTDVESEENYNKNKESSNKKLDGFLASLISRTMDDGKVEEGVMLTERKNTRDSQFNRGEKGSGERFISKDTILRMRRATKENPVVLTGVTKSMLRQGNNVPLVYYYDGSTLKRAPIVDGKIDPDGEGALIIDSNRIDLQMRYLDGIMKSVGMQETPENAKFFNGETTDLTVGPETAQDGTQASTQVNTQEESQGAVKPAANGQEGQTSGQEPNNGTERGLGADNGERGLRGGEEESDAGSQSDIDGTVPGTQQPQRPTSGEVRKLQNKVKKSITNLGGKVIAKAQYSPALKRISNKFHKSFGTPVVFYDASNMGENAAVGCTLRNNPEAGIFVAVNHKAMRRIGDRIVNGPGTAVFHENSHRQWKLFNGKETPQQIVTEAFVRSNANGIDILNAFHEILKEYGMKYAQQRGVLDALGVETINQWRDLSDAERANRFKQIPDDSRDFIKSLLYEELGNFLLTDDARLSSYQSFKDTIDAIRNVAVEVGLYTKENLDMAVSAAQELDDYAMREAEGVDGLKSIADTSNNPKPISEFNPDETFGVYEIPYTDENGKEQKTLGAFRNMSVAHAISALKHGGEPMPSIAVMKPSHGHEGFGEVTFVYGRETIDPSANPQNRVYSADAWTPQHPHISKETTYKSNAGDLLSAGLQASFAYGNDNGSLFYDDGSWASFGDESPKDKTVSSLARNPLIKFLVAKEAQLSKDEIYNGVSEKVVNIIDAIMEVGRNHAHSISIGPLFIDNEVSQADYESTFALDVIDDDWDPSFDPSFDEENYIPNPNAGESVKRQFSESEEFGDDEFYKKVVDALSGWFDYYVVDNPFENISEEDGIDLIAKAAQIIADASDYSSVSAYFVDNFIPDSLAQSFIESKLAGEEITKEVIRDRSNPKYDEKPYTLETALELMKQKPARRPVDLSGSLEMRSLAAHSFSSFEELKAHEGNLTPEKNHDKYRQEYKEAHEAVRKAQKLLDKVDHQQGIYDFEAIIRKYERIIDEQDTLFSKEDRQEILEMSIADVLSIEEPVDAGIVDVLNDTYNAVYDAVDKLANLPTGYFESKAQRIVYNNEIRRILVPAQYYPDMGVTYDADAAELVELAESLGIQTIPYNNDIQSSIEMAERKLSDAKADKEDAIVNHNMNAHNVRMESGPGGFEEWEEAFEDELHSYDITIEKYLEEVEELRKLRDTIKTRKEVMEKDITDVLFETPYTKEDARPGGKLSTSRSATQRDINTKGENVDLKRHETENASWGQAPDGTFISYTNKQRSEEADRRLATQEMADEEAKNLKTKENWNDQDIVTAERILFKQVMAIRDFMETKAYKLHPEAFQEMRKSHNELFDKYKKEKSKMGQGLQARYQFTLGEQIAMKAAKSFLGFTEDGRFAGAHPKAKHARIYAGIEDASKRIDRAVENGDTTALVQICKDISDIRNVKKMFGPLAGFVDGMETRMLNRIAEQDGAIEALQVLAYGNLNAVCDDIQPYKALNAVKTIRVMNMLSNISTIMNNLGNNAAQGALSNNPLGQAATQLAAKPFNELVGKKVVSKGKMGWIGNKDIRTAELDMLQTATLMQMYGVKYDGSKLELSDQGMFNPNVNAFESTMSLYKFLIGMGVEATDQVKQAGLLKSMELGIDEDIAAGKIAPEEKAMRMKEAEHEVRKLLYKDDNALTALVQHIRTFLNDKAYIGNDKTGKIGLGDLTMAFAKIPANVVRARLAMTPEGALYNLARYGMGVNKAKRMHAEVMAKEIAMDDSLSESEKWAKAKQLCKGQVFKKIDEISKSFAQTMTFAHAVEKAGYMDAKEMSQFEMAQLSRRIGRAASSAGMMVLGSVLRGIGALRDFDQEPDDELRKMYKEMGITGLQINLSKLFAPTSEWDFSKDLIVGGDWLEVVALPLSIGATAAECAMTEDGWSSKEYFIQSFAGGMSKAFEAAEDLPGMADAVNLYNSFNNAFNTDNTAKGSKVLNGTVQYLANALPTFVVPNLFSQASAGLDNTMRDVYSADTVWGQAWNIMKNKSGIIAGNILGLRDTIPASADVWGNERTYGNNSFMGFINKVVLPGDIRKLNADKYTLEVMRLMKSGYKGASPKTTVNKTFEVGDQSFTMDAEEARGFRLNRNSAEYDAFKAFMDSDMYKKLDDKQREAVFSALKTDAERTAKQAMLDGRKAGVQVNFDKWETELLELKDQINFLGTKEMIGTLWDKSENEVANYKKMDAFIKNDYRLMNETQRKLIDNSYSHINDLYEASQVGIDSENWQKAYNIYYKYNQTDNAKANVENEAKMWSEMQKATGYSDDSDKMKFFQENMELTYTGSPNVTTYNEMIYDYGVSRQSASKIYSKLATIEPAKGYAQPQNSQNWNYIVQSGVSDADQWAAYFSMVSSNSTVQKAKMEAKRIEGKTFKQAIHELGIDVVYWKEVLPNGKTKKYPIN